MKGIEVSATSGPAVTCAGTYLPQAALGRVQMMLPRQQIPPFGTAAMRRMSTSSPWHAAYARARAGRRAGIAQPAIGPAVEYRIHAQKVSSNRLSALRAAVTVGATDPDMELNQIRYFLAVASSQVFDVRSLSASGPS